ncbi:MAG: hypothetical protein ACP5NQ_01630 [Vulcanisaeta sp.]
MGRSSKSTPRGIVDKVVDDIEQVVKFDRKGFLAFLLIVILNNGLIDAGSKSIRLNFSHHKYELWRPVIERMEREFGFYEGEDEKRGVKYVEVSSDNAVALVKELYAEQDLRELIDLALSLGADKAKQLLMLANIQLES